MFWSKKFQEEKKKFEISKAILENKINEFNLEYSSLCKKLEQQEKQLKKLNKADEKLKERECDIKKLYDDTFNSIDWLSGLYSEFYFLTDCHNTRFFSYGLNCTETAKRLSKENRVLREELMNQRLVNNKLSLGYSDKLGNIKDKEKEIDEKILQFKNIYDDTFNTVEWLTEKYSEFHFLVDKEKIEKFDNSLKATKTLNLVSKENKSLRKRNLELELKIRQIEILFPDFDDITSADISDFNTDITDELDINDTIDFLVPLYEQKKHTKSEILQIALDKYVNKKKSKFSIGKDYERYIGFLYEQKGYIVEYHGIKHGFDDLGIDLICKKENETLLIQCKNWSQKKQIHENAINQLFGTSIKYYIEKYDSYQQIFRGTLFEEKNLPFNNNFQPIFITTTNLSERAMEFAEMLKIKILVIPYDKNYPRIKCNNGKDKDNNQIKIFHLPFDQMYDKVQNIKNGGCNVFTIAEAEKLGYRKAFRWRGEK